MKNIFEVNMKARVPKILAAGLTVACGTFGKPAAKCDVLPKPANVVAQPPYVTEAPCPQAKDAEDKLQYRAKLESQPSFAEKESEAGEENGAFYDLGTELYVAPGPMITETDQPILEADSEPAPAIPKP